VEVDKEEEDVLGKGVNNERVKEKVVLEEGVDNERVTMVEPAHKWPIV
jgi:hypothetical protein